MRFGSIANSARGGPQRPPPMGDRVKMILFFDVLCFYSLFILYTVKLMSNLFLSKLNRD